MRNLCLVPRGPHSRPQRPRSFWSAPRIATSGQVQHRKNNQQTSRECMIFIREQNEVTHICPQRMQFVVLTKRTAVSEDINFDHGCAHAQPLSRPSRTSFSSTEATLLLVSTKNRDLWPSPTPEVRDSRTSLHSAHVQSQVCKSDWFWSQSIVFTKPFKNGMSLDQARGLTRGRDSWC